MRSRGPQILRVESLGDHPLIKYGFNTMERPTHADIANSSNLVAARNELLRTIQEKEELIWKNLKECLLPFLEIYRVCLLKGVGVEVEVGLRFGAGAGAEAGV
ncbi:hypothetical protein Tco_0296464 [Tanacetum coccineum]